MKDYSYLDDRLLSATRSLPFYFDFYSFIKKNSSRLDLNNIDKLSVQLLIYLPQYLIEFLEQFLSIIRKFPISDYLDSCKAVHNAYMKTTRLKSRIMRMYEYFDKLYFVTFTIDDKKIPDGINLYDIEYFNSMAVFACKMTSSLYVVNSDFGDLNNRLHFHAVISCDISDEILKFWTFGNIKKQTITNGAIDTRRLSRYCTKLARHATKQTTYFITFSRFGKVRKR